MAPAHQTSDLHGFFRPLDKTRQRFTAMPHPFVRASHFPSESPLRSADFDDDIADATGSEDDDSNANYIVDEKFATSVDILGVILNSMQKMEEVVQVTLDPTRRRRQIRKLERRLLFSRVVLFIAAAVTVLNLVTSALAGRAHSSGLFMAITAVLFAAHTGMTSRLVQLKVEEERLKKTDGQCDRV